MKTLFASVLVAFTLATAPVIADTPAPFRSAVQPRVDGLKVDVVVEKAVDARLTVKLLNASGQTLAVQTLFKGNKVARTRFDVAELPDGLYTVVITDGTRVETQVVSLNTPVRTLAAL